MTLTTCLLLLGSNPNNSRFAKNHVHWKNVRPYISVWFHQIAQKLKLHDFTHTRPWYLTFFRPSTGKIPSREIVELHAFGRRSLDLYGAWDAQALRHFIKEWRNGAMHTRRHIWFRLSPIDNSRMLRWIVYCLSGLPNLAKFCKMMLVALLRDRIRQSMMRIIMAACVVRG